MNFSKIPTDAKNYISLQLNDLQNDIKVLGACKQLQEQKHSINKINKSINKIKSKLNNQQK